LALFAVLYFLLFKTYYDSKYRIDGETLWCKMGLFQQKINIHTIASITDSDYPAAGNRPALNLNGIKVNYGMGYTIFLTPSDKTHFINNLLQVNPKINILKIN
ncbi:MAG: PH domain-containing protein, partial [Saprospiraceae bacterium]